MKVAFTGTHGIGKTTLVRKVWASQLGYNVPVRFGEMINEQARVVAARQGIGSLADIKYWDREKIDYFQWMVMANQMTAESRPASFISDRCVIDNLAYTIYYDCAKEMQEGFKHLCRMHTKLYDAIFYLPIPTDMMIRDADDGFRMPDLKSMEDVDNIIIPLLDLAECQFFALGDIRGKWEEEVSEIIEGLL